MRLVVGDLDSLRRRAQVVVAVAAIVEPYPFAGFAGEPLSTSR